MIWRGQLNNDVIKHALVVKYTTRILNVIFNHPMWTCKHVPILINLIQWHMVRMKVSTFTVCFSFSVHVAPKIAYTALQHELNKSLKHVIT
jgi:hypothetical protein